MRETSPRNHRGEKGRGGAKKQRKHHGQVKRRALGKRKPAKKSVRKKIKKSRNIYKEVLLATVLGLVFSFFMGSLFFRIASVRGFGMTPTLREGDCILLKKTSEFKRFELGVFSSARGLQVRRIIGLPGEKISYSGDTLYVDDQQIDEKFIVAEINKSQQSGSDYTEDFSVSDLISSAAVPEDHYLVLGDNRRYATDSRHYGLIKSERFVGKVLFRIIPVTEWQGF